MRTPKEREAAGLPEPKKRAPRKPKPTKEVKTVEDLQMYSTDGDLVDVWSRRMLNPAVILNTSIQLKTPGMKIRWINLTNNGRYQRARYHEGWAPVHKDELADEREIYGVSYTAEGFVCKGEKQSEMLMKIPMAVWKKIQQAKYDQVLKSRKNIKENLQGAGAKHFSDKYNSNVGHEIASRMDAFKGDIKFGTEDYDPNNDPGADHDGALEHVED